MSPSGPGLPEESEVSSAPAPESYVWPLVALVLVILPQVLVPARMRLEPPSIVPTRFPDHLYQSYTNVVAFSPTDTLPLTGRAKGLMALQSIISLAVLVVVLARVINILPS